VTWRIPARAQMSRPLRVTSFAIRDTLPLEIRFFLCLISAVVLFSHIPSAAPKSKQQAVLCRTVRFCERRIIPALIWQKWVGFCAPSYTSVMSDRQKVAY
jgi:hypothetical protein